MIRRLGSVALALALAAWTACSEYADGEPPSVVDDAGSDASTSGSSGSADAEVEASSSSDAGTDADASSGTFDCRDTSLDRALVCPVSAMELETCSTNRRCCPGKGCLSATSCGGDLGDGADDWQCFGPDQCSSGRRCFVRQAELRDDATSKACGSSRTIKLLHPPYLSVARCLESPPSSPWAQLCKTNDECEGTGAACLPTTVEVGGARVVVRACESQ